MKEVIALIVFLALVIFTFYLTLSHKIDTKITIVFLIFSIISGFIISNYDIIKKLKWKGFELETFKQDVSEIKSKALKEIREDVDDQKQSIKLLITSANDTRSNLDIQIRIVESLIDKVKVTEESIKKQAINVNKLNLRAEKTKQQISILHNASTELALLLTKITWLQLETKSEFGTDRAQKAMDDIFEDLNKIIAVVIPNGQDRAKWINDLQSSLPKRK